MTNDLPLARDGKARRWRSKGRRLRECDARSFGVDGMIVTSRHAIT
jgi:hypothetical protein